MRTASGARSILAVVLTLSLGALSACGGEGKAEPTEVTEVTEVSAASSAKDAAAPADTASDATSAAAMDAAAGSTAPSSRYEHQFAETYAGPVWITITSEADAADVMLAWGPYSVSFEHRGASASYWFTKSAADAPGAGVPVTVMVAPAATVTFHEGDPPADAIDVNEGWTQQG